MHRRVRLLLLSLGLDPARVSGLRTRVTLRPVLGLIGMSEREFCLPGSTFTRLLRDRFFRHLRQPAVEVPLPYDLVTWSPP